MKYRHAFVAGSWEEDAQGSIDTRNIAFEEVYSWKQESTSKTRSLGDYISFHLKINITGFLVSVIITVVLFLTGYWLVAMVGLFATLAFLEMLITVLVDKKTSLKNAKRRN